jgi:class 3 adenylate cyclase
MATPSKSPESERKRLEQTIVALEAQRAILGDEAADAAIASLRRELSALEKAEPEPGRRKAGERRVVTILFCDIKGSTAAAERLDPEEWTEIMNEAFEYMIQPVSRYEGTVARLMGDAILAFFGAPVAHEDDPRRAILAGLEIVQDVQPYRKQISAEWGVDFDVRVGINTGLVVVGDVGSDLRMEYTAMGDAINLAARMEQTAVPGTVQVSEGTYNLVAPLFEFEDLGYIEVKGKSEPVKTYRPLRQKADPGRLRGISGLKPQLIGRRQEKDLLEKAIENLGKGIN